MIRKLLCILLLLTTQQLQTSPGCRTTLTKDPEVGTMTGHSTPQYAGCTCPCNKKRYFGIICSECRHTVAAQNIQGTSRSERTTMSSLVERISKP